MNRRQNHGRRCQIVRQFLADLTDDTQRLVCFLLTRGCPDKEVCQALRLTSKRLELVKLQIAIGLRQAGIEWTEVR
jgi:hypothetical protein